MPHVDLIGPHPTEFLEHLKAADYTYTLYKTYSECPLSSDKPPAALAVHGHDVALESTEAILKVLKSKVVLLLFCPTLELLRILKGAIKTSIDLPNVKLEDGVPLVVYQLQGIDCYHLIPGLLKSDSPSNAQAHSPSESLHHAVKLIAQCQSHASNAVAQRESSDANFANTLVPPLGTCYFKSDLTTIADSKTVSGVTYSIQWQVQVYAYGTDTSPPNTVYTVLKYGGQLTAAAPWKRDFHIGYYKVLDKNQKLVNYYYSPTGGTQQGSTTIYNVELNQRVNLFQGTTCESKLDYQLTYDEQYTRTNWVTETSSTPSVYGHRVDLNEVLPLTDGNHSEALATTTYVIRGIVVFKSSPTIANLGFEASIGPLTKSQDLRLDLNF